MVDICKKNFTDFLEKSVPSKSMFSDAISLAEKLDLSEQEALAQVLVTIAGRKSENSISITKT